MPEGALTTLEYALLGLVAMRPMSGYDVHRVFATTPMAHFSSSPGAIYPALRRLARRGLLKAALDRATEARPRRVYALTRGGEEALHAWLRQPVTREDLVRGSGAPILRFALAEGRVSKEEVLAYLMTYRRTLESYLEELQGHAREMPAAAGLHPRLALERGIRGYQGDLEWVRSAAAKIRRTGRGPRKRRGRVEG
jgi:DNA-binding PadR family transcriptional regulator